MSSAPAGDLSRDRLLGGRLVLEQPRQGHRAAIDALFLAAAVPARAGEHLLDAGAGSGVVGLAVACRVAGLAITAVEIDPDLARLAERNAGLNDLAERYRAVAADITAPAAELEAAGLAPSAFDHAAANPPYLDEGTTRPQQSAQRRRAAAMPAGDLDLWVRRIAALVRPGGTATIVHRADRMVELLALLDGRFGALAVLALHPRAGAPASRILVQGIKGSRAPLRLLPGLVLHDAAGGFLPEAEAVLREGKALGLAPT